MRQIQFVGKDGTQLHGGIYFPLNNQKSQAVIFLVHGLGVHHRDFAKLINFLVANNYTVATFDLRGHGLSEGIRGHINRWSDYRNDFTQFVLAVAAEIPEQPSIIIGHSLGSMIVAEMVLRGHLKHIPPMSKHFITYGVVLIGFPAEPGPRQKRWVELMGKWLSRLFPRYTMKLKIPKSKQLAVDSLKQLRQSDPLNHRQFSLRWAYETAPLIREFVKAEQSIDYPLLMVHGEADHMARHSGAKAFYERMQAANKQFLSYPEVHHEPHQHDLAEQFFEDLKVWLEERLATV